MTRWWNELIGDLAGSLSGGVPMLAFVSLLATILIALAAYFWPSWLPWNWGLRWRRGGSSRDRTAKGGPRRFRLGALSATPEVMAAARAAGFGTTLLPIGQFWAATEPSPAEVAKAAGCAVRA